jgi:hypothetical protein
MSRQPLANDLNGNPIDVPENAIAWRVRRASGKQGRPQNVYDPETGRQLEIPLESTVHHLREHGCGEGRFRLEAIDQEGKTIAGIVAFTEIRDDEDNPTGAAPQVETKGLLELVGRLVDTNCRAMEAMANAFGPVRPARHFLDEQAPLDEPVRPDEIVQNVATIAKTVAEAWKGQGGGS